MALLKKSATIKLAGYKVTVDAEDAERVQAVKWIPFPVNGNGMTFYSEQAGQLLAGYVLGLPAEVFAVQINPGLDFRRRNLTAYRAPLPKETRQR